MSSGFSILPSLLAARKSILARLCPIFSGAITVSALSLERYHTADLTKTRPRGARDRPHRDHISVLKVGEYKRGTGGYNGARIRKKFALIQDQQERKRGRR